MRWFGEWLYPTATASFPGGDYVRVARGGCWNISKTEMPAERKALFYSALAYPSYVSHKFTEEPDKEGSSEKPPFSPVEPHEAPKRFVLRKKYSSLSSLINTVNFIPAVDEPLKIIIEHFEPGVHRFFPLEISMPSRENYQTYLENYPKRFFILAIGQYIDSFSMAQSDPDSWKHNGPEHFQYKDDKKSMSGLALSKQAFGSAHLWRERRMSMPLICFSDTLMAEINKVGLRLPKHYQLKEI